MKGGADALNEALRLAAEAATHFGTTISEQQLIAETRDKLGLPAPDTGVPHSADPNVARLERIRALELDNLHLSDAEEARIRALDLNTAEGRARLLAFEQDLFRRAAAGELTDEQLQNFKSVSELLPVINDAADGLNAFRDATADATRRIGDFNLPEGFKRASIAFKNAAEGPFIPPAPPPVPGSGLIPPTGTPGPSITVPPEFVAAQTAANVALQSIATKTLLICLPRSGLSRPSLRSVVFRPTGLGMVSRPRHSRRSRRAPAAALQQ